MSLPMEQREVILGVDTHLDVHVAVLIDEVGRTVATNSFPTTASGYEQLMKWASSFGRLGRAGVEGTGTYGAGLARHMQERGVKVLEINRPNRSRRRLRGKSDPTDAEMQRGLYSPATPMPSPRRSRAWSRRCARLAWPGVAQ